ncbi:MAG TPA: HAD-IC family P-type ATPase, partial [Solirubrobacterales bacterium]
MTPDNQPQTRTTPDGEPQVQTTTSSERHQSRSLFDREILRPALWESVTKLDPRVQVRNPVMFVVEIGAVITTVAWLIQVFGGESLGGGHQPAWFTFSITIWLWLTVVFANLAEALAEGRGRAQAASLRAMRTEASAKMRDGTEKSAAELVRGDIVVVEAGEGIPGDGTVIEGIASVDESAITGESAPVIRESGGDRSAVTGGTRVLSDQIVVEITQEPGHSFLDRMIALVEGASRRKTPNEIALGILLAALTLIFIVVIVSLRPFALFAHTELSETTAKLRDGGEKPAAELVRGDVVVVEAGETIPGDGTVIEGIASVDESAITGESAPVIRAAGGDRSAVTGGTKVLSDRIVVEITQEPGGS